MAEPIRDWLTYLAGLNVGALGKREVEWRLAALAPALAHEFNAKAFTPDSARYVASRCTHFPVFGEIVPLLRDWQRETKLTFGLLLSDHSAYEPPPQQPERTPEELEHAARLVAEVTATLRHHDGEKEAWYHRGPDNWRRPAAEMTRAQLNEAYRRESIKGPQVPEPVHAAATVIPMSVKRGPTLDEKTL